MPTYIEHQNLIIPKDTIYTKYKGGMEHFKKWFDENKGSKWQEDKECFLIARMNSDDADI